MTRNHFGRRLNVMLDGVYTETGDIKDSIYKILLDEINEVVWVMNIESGEFILSEKWKYYSSECICSYSNVNEFIERHVHADEREKLRKEISNHLLGYTLTLECEFRVVSPRRDDRWVLLRGKLIKNTEGKATALSGLITDNHERKMTEERISHMAYYDNLTELPNKLLFQKLLEDAVNESRITSKKGAVILLDLDNFKMVNDTLGHDIGDLLLKIMSELLKFTVGENNKVARFGGDEFLILLKGFESSGEIMDLCTSIMNNFKYAFELSDKQVYVTASLGISIFPDDSSSVTELMRNIDTAMYKSKECGKNTFTFFSKEMSDEMQRKREIEHYLRNAIENNEFRMVYQPQITIEGGRLYGFEALIRWRNDFLGPVSPKEFIPVAEESGLIIRVGEWVIRETCRQLKEWDDEGYKVSSMSVNISPYQIRNRNFKGKLRQIIYDSKIKPENLKIEITEGAFINASAVTIDLLNDIKNIGINLSIDDFGTGYSALNYLTYLPFDSLKIDKCFIDKINESKKYYGIVECIIKLSHSLGLDVVAEGVESKDQLDVLEEIGCDHIQGFYFSKPLSPDQAILNYLKR